MKKLFLPVLMLLASLSVHAEDIVGTFQCPSGLVFFNQTAGMNSITFTNFVTNQYELYSYNGGVSRIVLATGNPATIYRAYNAVGQVAIVGTSAALLRDGMISFNSTNLRPEYCRIVGSLRG